MMHWRLEGSRQDTLVCATGIGRDLKHEHEMKHGLRGGERIATWIREPRGGRGWVPVSTWKHPHVRDSRSCVSVVFTVT